MPVRRPALLRCRASRSCRLLLLTADADKGVDPGSFPLMGFAASDRKPGKEGNERKVAATGKREARGGAKIGAKMTEA